MLIILRIVGGIILSVVLAYLFGTMGWHMQYVRFSPWLMHLLLVVAGAVFLGFCSVYFLQKKNWPVDTIVARFTKISLLIFPLLSICILGGILYLFFGANMSPTAQFNVGRGADVFDVWSFWVDAILPVTAISLVCVLVLSILFVTSLTYRPLKSYAWVLGLGLLISLLAFSFVTVSIPTA